MSVYSNIEIRKAITQGHIVCHPLINENIRGSSIDMTLGEWFYRCDRPLPDMFKPFDRPNGIYNPFDEKDVGKYFGEPHKAVSAEMSGGEIPELEGIPVDHPVIMIPARSRILAHSHEFIGIHPPGTSEMRARSSWGRNGISACLCAGWGDPGYINRWTHEITNFNDEAVPLPVGERISQLVFHQTGQVSGHYGGEGKYQSSEDLDEVISTWVPSMMLPRAYKDQRRLPLPL